MTSSQFSVIILVISNRLSVINWNCWPNFRLPSTRYALRTTIYLFLFAATILSLTACQQPSPTPLRFAVHTLQPDDQILALAHAAEFDTIVQVFPWREVEPTQNQFHWAATDRFMAGAEHYGFEVIVRLDQHPARASSVELGLNAPPEKLEEYEDYVERIATRYRGRVRAYIIWNEPNLAIEWGGQRPDPVAFTELLAVGYQAVKAGDPEALVVAAGLAPTNSNDLQGMDDRLFLREMYRAGAADYFDVLAAHPYSFGQAPAAPEQDNQHPAFGRLAEMRTIIVENDDAHKPVWITEMGWTIAPPSGQADIKVSLQQQARYLSEALDIIERDWPWVELVTVWNLSLPGEGDPFGGYSLLDASGTPRPAYEAWRKRVPSRAARGIKPSTPHQADAVTILARDAIIHLGDTDLQPPWWPLFAGRKPSLQWVGGFYLTEPGQIPWHLSFELMQQNELGATLAINGVPLSPDLPQQDFTRRWLTVHREVPAELLQPGYNELTLTTVRLLPDAQHDEFVWDDFQIRNIRLNRAK
ncbi:MAG: hypothetical protein R3264_06770 [Anaerolineae bacterium]|nr:hypothetical protein [Anaerolineae bacterium]